MNDKNPSFEINLNSGFQKNESDKSNVFEINLIGGAQGIQGNIGPQGIQGPQGERGRQGEQGIQGEQGPQGNIGLTPNFSVGIVQKSEEASASITGTAENPILNLNLPKGDKGEQGKEGKQGERGPSAVVIQTEEPTDEDVLIWVDEDDDSDEIFNPDNYVHTDDYVATENNYTDEDKEKLDGLSNYDDTNIKKDISDLQEDKADKTEIPDVSKFIDNTVNNLLNYYLKNETYNREEVMALINAIQTVQIEIVDVLPTTGENNIIYFVPNEEQKANNIYDEYIYVNNSWELIGSTAVDLANYYTKDEINNLLNNYALKTEIPDLTDYVKNTDYASNSKAGVIFASTTFGLNVNWQNGRIQTEKATDTEIEALSSDYKPIVPSNLSKAVQTIGGNLENLSTQDKTNYVNAINELDTNKQDNLIVGDGIDLTNDVVSVKLGTGVEIVDGVVQAKLKTWKKVRDFIVPSDEQAGETIDGIKFATSNVGGGETGITSFRFSTDLDGNEITGHQVTDCMIRMKPVETTNINQGFIRPTTGSGNDIDYFIGLRGTDTKYRHWQLPLSGDRVSNASNNQLYVYENKSQYSEYTGLYFRGHENTSVLGEGSRFEIWMYGYWNEEVIINE